MNNYVLIYFEISEAYLQGKFLEMELLNQKVSAYIILLDIVKFHLNRMYQFAFSPITALPTAFVVLLFLIFTSRMGEK